MTAFLCYDHLFQDAFWLLQIKPICCASNKIRSEGRKQKRSCVSKRDEPEPCIVAQQ